MKLIFENWRHFIKEEVHTTGGYTGVDYDEAGEPIGYTGYDVEADPEDPWPHGIPHEEIQALMAENPGMNWQQAADQIRTEQG